MGDISFNFGANVPDRKDDDCFGMLVCPHCGKSVICQDVPTNQTVATEENMIPRNTNTSGGGGGRGGKRRSGFPFLATDKCSTDHEPGVIIGARVEDDSFRKGDQVVALKLRYKSQLWLYNLRPSNPVMDTLANAFGDDEAQWVNKKVVIYNEEDDFNGKLWLRIDPAEDDPGTSDEPATATAKKRRG